MKTLTKDEIDASLNPYSNGICSLSRKQTATFFYICCVLILILMEYAL